LKPPDIKSSALHSINNHNKAFPKKGKPFHLPGLLTALADFIYPPVCALCSGRLDDEMFLCGDCFHQLEQAIHVCAAYRPSDFVHLQEPILFHRAVTCFHFDPDIEQLIHEVKYNHRKKMGRFFGRLMARILADEIKPEFDLIVPVPLHTIRYRERGYNQSEALARGFAQERGLFVRTDCLKRVLHTKTQTMLSGKERQDNVREAFSVRKEKLCKGKRILLVDDVITTGATINGCARALKAAGANRITALALARPVLV